MYQEFLGRPGGEKSHKYLHTHYTAKEKYNIYAQNYCGCEKYSLENK